MTVKGKLKRNNTYFNDLITRSVHHSNAIEGNTLSYFETYSLLFNSSEYINSRQIREIYEAINLKYALDYVMRNSNKPITLDMIIKIATFINKNILDIKVFREDYVSIRGSQHTPPSHLYIRKYISEILYTYYNSKEDLDTRIARLHIDFERVHPFQDGNGRTGRVLIFKEYIVNNLLPPVITLDQRPTYMNLLETYSIKGLSELLKTNRQLEDIRYTQVKGHS